MAKFWYSHSARAITNEVMKTRDAAQGEQMLAGQRDSGFSGFLRAWRRRRRMSQLELALAANISQRHISFLENGRSSPTHSSVIALSQALHMPVAERDAMLLAAGIKQPLSDQRLEQAARDAIDASMDYVLQSHNPYPAMTVDALWNLQQANEAAQAFFCAVGSIGESNLLRALLLPGPVKDNLNNWDSVARGMLRLFELEALRRPNDVAAQSLLSALRSDPDVAAVLTQPEEGAVAPVMTLAFAVDGIELRVFTLIATIGMSTEARLDDIRLETLLPADAASRAWFERQGK